MRNIWILSGLILSLFLFNSVFGFETTRRCLNDTHLETLMNWTECDGSCTAKSNIQVTNCTMPTDSTSRCDSSVNQCKFVRRSDSGDIIAFSIVTFMTGMFFWLGLKVQPEKEFSMMKNGLQTLFFFMGFWMLVLDTGMAQTIAVSTGVSESTLNLVEETILLMSWIIYIVMALLIFSYVFSVLWLMLPSKRK